MAKRKVVEVQDTPEAPVVRKRNNAETFAHQRRIEVLSVSEGEQLLALLGKIKVKTVSRGNAELRYVQVNPARFVIDLSR